MGTETALNLALMVMVVLDKSGATKTEKLAVIQIVRQLLRVSEAEAHS